VKAATKKRWAEVETKPLLVGGHDPDGQMCVMEMVAYVANEPWSDHPACVSPVLGAFLRAWNDGLGDEDRQKLKPYVLRVMDTAGDPEADERRAWMATDWLVRTCAPAFLRLAKLDTEADALAGLPELVDKKTAKAIQPTLNEARKKSAAARDAAWAAAGAAAWDAAGAAAWDAAGAAAWDAAGAAAWDAAGAAAWAAAGAALRPTVEELQTSAFQLLDRMVEA
jgi:hypothetical protein